MESRAELRFLNSGQLSCCRPGRGGFGTCGRALTEVMPQPRKQLSTLQQSLSRSTRRLVSSDRDRSLRSPGTVTGAAARTRPSGQNWVTVGSGQGVSQEQGGLAEATVAPRTEKNAVSSPSSNSAAANAAIFAWWRDAEQYAGKRFSNILNKM